jgi:WD40 repeat protein
MNVSSTAKGKEFENEIAELYRLMGYEVKQNVELLGHQIDIVLVYKLPGGTETRTAVECKYLSEGNLRKDEAMESILALVDLKRNDEAQNLVIVTTNGFSKEIWNTARANKIQLLTFRELQHQILALDNYLDCIIAGFETDELSKYYVDLVAQDDETMPNKIFPIDKYVDEWIHNDQINHLSILGEYGTGKTSFCRKLAYDLAKKYRKDPLNNRIPILINLRDYSKVMSVRQLITDLLINEYRIRGIDFSLFEKMNRDGLFLLIFDGFDEMAQKVIFDVAYSNFSKIAELAEMKKSKLILTCRTEFFRTHEKEKEILVDIAKRENFDIVYLRQFDDAQIRDFLQKRVPLIETEKKEKRGWEYYYKKIQEVFDLSDLAKRPVLLELITKYLPQLIEQGRKIDASTLYMTTIQEELKRRLKVGATVIQRDDRIKLMKLLAAWMYNNDRLYVHYESIPDLLNLKSNFDLKTTLDIEYHLNDFLTCSFLNRDAEGNYRFSHKSLVDFLVAFKFVDDVKNNFERDFIQKPITYEVIQFIKDLNVDKETLYRWIRSTKNRSFTETKYLGGNAVSILNELEEDFAEKKLDFSRTVLDNANFNGQDLTGLNFRGASLTNANLSNTTLRNTDFSFAKLEGVVFTRSGAIYEIAYSPNGKYIVSVGQDKNVKVWDMAGMKEAATLKGHFNSVMDVAFSPDGRLIATAGHDQKVILWDLVELKEIEVLRAHCNSVRTVAFSPDGEYLASAGYDEVIRIWDTASLKQKAVLHGHSEGVLSIAFSPDGKFLASASHDETVRIWDIVKLREAAILKGLSGSIMTVAFSPDGKLIAGAGKDNNVTIWRMDGFWKMAILQGHKDSVRSLAFSPDGKFIASASFDEVVRIWDAVTFREVKTLRGHSSGVLGVAFSPDGKFLASASNDETIRIWDMHSKENFGECVHILRAQMNCEGMLLENAALDFEEKRLLLEKGAIEHPWQRKEYKRLGR